MGGMNTFNDNDTRGILDLLEGVGGMSIIGGSRPPKSSPVAAKSGHAVLPSGAPAASYSVSTPISGGTQTNSIRPGVTGGFKLEWALTGFDATQVNALRTLELVSPLYNPLPIALPSDAVVQWKENVDGFKMIDIWICGTGVAGPISVGGDISDPVNENSSKSISMGYTIGV